MLGFDSSLDLIMRISDYKQLSRYLETVHSVVFTCVVVCVYTHTHTHTHIAIHTDIHKYLYTHCLQFNALLQFVRLTNTCSKTP